MSLETVTDIALLVLGIAVMSFGLVLGLLCEPWVNPNPAQKALRRLFYCNIPIFFTWMVQKHVICRVQAGAQDGRYACPFGGFLLQHTIFDPNSYPENACYTWLIANFTHWSSSHAYSNTWGFIELAYLAHWTVPLWPIDIYLIAFGSSIHCILGMCLRRQLLGGFIVVNGASGMLYGLWAASMVTIDTRDWHWTFQRAVIGFTAYSISWWAWTEYQAQFDVHETGRACHLMALLWGTLYGCLRRWFHD